MMMMKMMKMMMKMMKMMKKMKQKKKKKKTMVIWWISLVMSRQTDTLRRTESGYYKRYQALTGDDVDEMVDFFSDGRVFGFEAGSQDGDSAHGSSVSGLNDDSFGRTLDGVGGEKRHVSMGKENISDSVNDL